MALCHTRSVTVIAKDNIIGYLALVRRGTMIAMSPDMQATKNASLETLAQAILAKLDARYMRDDVLDMLDKRAANRGDWGERQVWFWRSFTKG